MRNYLYYKERNICVDCKKEKITDGKTRCEKCRAKHRQYHNNDFIKVKKKLEYRELKAKGICVECKKAKAVEGLIRCEICREKRNQYAREYNKKMTSIEIVE